MYLSYYELNKKPFQISVDPSFLWMSEKHKEALAMLRYGILDNRGFITLTGNVGTGKTTLINELINRLESDVLVANISNPGLRPTDFFNHLGLAFNLGKKFYRKGDFLTAFQSFLEKTYHEGKQVLLIIDEAQRLKWDMLEEIRLLSNIELQHVKLLNVFFVGQDEFYEMLNRHKCNALRQRMTIQFHLEPLSKSEVVEYIEHRLRIAGIENKIFTENAIQEIHKFSEGYPRVINIICDHAMLTGYSKKLKTIDAREIIECTNELRLKKNRGYNQNRRRQVKPQLSEISPVSDRIIDIESRRRVDGRAVGAGDPFISEAQKSRDTLLSGSSTVLRKTINRIKSACLTPLF